MEADNLLNENKNETNNKHSSSSNTNYESCESSNSEFIVNEEKEWIRKKKARDIEIYLEKNRYSLDSNYINKLRSFALSEGGLINDDIRRRVWPLLLDIQPEHLEPLPKEVDFRTHAEFSQVVLDVNRSIKRFPPGIPYDQRVAMQDQLIRLILRVIKKYPQLQYYQGYHDVAITFLLVVGENMSFHIMEKLSTNHLKHFMETTMEKTSELLDYIFPLIEHIHPELCSFIDKSDVGGMFSLPWFLTWYSHTLTKYENVMRLYDYFLASEALTPLYLIPIIVVYRQDVIFETECEMSALHQALSQLPDDLPFDHLLLQATELYNQYPPEHIEKEVIIRRIKKKAALEERLEMQKTVKEKIRLNKIKHSNENQPSWKFMHRVIPDWFLPHSRFRFLLVSASFFVGLYAYYRYSNSTEVYNQQNIVTK